MLNVDDLDESSIGETLQRYIVQYKRFLAETGFKDLFTGLYNEIAEAPNQRRALRLTGQWTDIDTSAFDASMGVEVNPTMGKGSDTTRMMVLQQIKQDQMMVFQQFGPSNPVVGIPEMLNTITDILDLSNIKNVGRYFKSVDPATLQAMSNAPKEPDAMTIAAKASYEKVKSDAVQALSAQQLQQQKQLQDDVFRHEQLRAKTAYEAQKLDLERAKAGATHMSDIDDRAADVFKATMAAGTQQHVAHVGAAADITAEAQRAQAASAAAEAAAQAQAQQQATPPQGGSEG